jgi:hypothetical protein
MAKKKKAVAEENRFKVFAFMINPHEMQIVGENGVFDDKISVESEEQAKEVLMSEMLNAKLTADLGTPDFVTVWEKDPAGNQEVMEACKKMEDIKVVSAAVETAESPAAMADLGPEGTPEPSPENKLKIHTTGLVFQAKINGVWKNMATAILSVGDECRFFPQNQEPDDKIFIVTAAPVKDESGPDYFIEVEPIEAKTEPEPEQSKIEPQFKTSKTKVIQVEVPETHSEQHLKEMVRHLQCLKIEAQSEAAQWRDRIKEQEKALFAACNGKSFTSMECIIENDWEGGIRKYIRPDTGEVALTEKISYEERQINMHQALADATPKPEEIIAEGVEALAAVDEMNVASDETIQAESETTAEEFDTGGAELETKATEPEPFDASAETDGGVQVEEAAA